MDPEISADSTLVPSPSPRQKNPVFEDEIKGKKLAELLKSKKAEDLQEANRLIKSMVKEDEARAQKAARQHSTLEAANNSVKLLNEMLAHFSPHESTDGDKELIQELYGDCDKLRQKISQLASETEDNDKSLGEILQASDDLSQVINSCKKLMAEIKINGRHDERQQTQITADSNQPEVLVDLMDLEVENPSQPEHQQLPPLFSDDLLCGAALPAFHTPSEPSVAASLLDEELLSLGLHEPGPVLKESTDENLRNHLLSQQDFSQDLDLFGTASPAVPPSSTSSHLFFSSPVTSFKPSTTTSTVSIQTFLGPLFPTAPLPTLSFSSNSVISPIPVSSVQPPTSHASLPQPFNITSSSLSAVADTSQHGPLSSSVSSLTSCGQNVSDLSLLDLNAMNKPGSISSTFTSITSAVIQSEADEKDLLRSLSPILPPTQAGVDRGAAVSLNNVVVPLETIKPSKICPVTAYDKKGVRVLLHFATDCPPGRPDVLVMVASILNTSPQAVRKMVLQVAVPKTMKVKLQSPSGTELAPFNPILPPAAITQVMLLANPLKEKVRMRFKLTFMLEEQSITEVGEVDEFPPADTWGAL
ncbi:ADP-ribosylation factor-binding protein GGA3a isoform X2 [Gouania willdenowi]|nr:ADP-ribosylation factor-binding protein GGA3-like isoform X2 [Gouania willdenowi]